MASRISLCSPRVIQIGAHVGKLVGILVGACVIQFSVSAASAAQTHAPSVPKAPAKPPAAAATPAASPSMSNILGAAASLLPAQPIKIVTRAVGEVGERILTSREVRIGVAIDHALAEKIADAAAIPSGLEKSFPNDVTRALDEWVVYLEAKSLSDQGPSRAEVSSAMRAVQGRWGEKAAWLDLEASDAELKEMIERKLIARSFERLKSDPQLSPVSDEDALNYYRKNRLRFGSSPFASFKDSIKSFLIKQQTDRRMVEWREVLRRKYKVKNFIAG